MDKNRVFDSEVSNQINKHVCQSVTTLTRGVASTNKLWDEYSTITVSFINGSEWQKYLVTEIHKQWNPFINLKFKFIETDGMIRISFDTGGSWSHVGKNALLIPKPDATCNFGWLTNTMAVDDETALALILHEWGHVLGFEHEQNHPGKTIPYNVDKVYGYYNSIGWTDAQIKKWVLGSFSYKETTVSAYDKDSIMHYPVDNSLTDGGWSVSWVTKLSIQDKLFASQLYPPDIRSGVIKANVHFRKTPGYLHKNSEDILTVIPAGTEVKVKSGPELKDGLQWFKVTHVVEVDGWVARRVGKIELLAVS